MTPDKTTWIMDAMNFTQGVLKTEKKKIKKANLKEFQEQRNPRRDLFCEEVLFPKAFFFLSPMSESEVSLLPFPIALLYL